MPKLTLSKSFQKDLNGLQQSSRKHYQRTCELLFEIQTGQGPSAHRRSESRIPECIKYELPNGYRLVLQKAENAAALVALVVGTHDHVESYLDGPRDMSSMLRVGECGHYLSPPLTKPTLMSHLLLQCRHKLTRHPQTAQYLDHFHRKCLLVSVFLKTSLNPC